MVINISLSFSQELSIIQHLLFQAACKKGQFPPTASWVCPSRYRIWEVLGKRGGNEASLSLLSLPYLCFFDGFTFFLHQIVNAVKELVRKMGSFFVRVLDGKRKISKCSLRKADTVTFMRQPVARLVWLLKEQLGLPFFLNQFLSRPNLFYFSDVKQLMLPSSKEKDVWELQTQDNSRCP